MLAENFTMILERLSWILVGLSLLGNIFVIRKNVIGQWLWAIANVGWVAYDLWIGANSQAFLFFVYLLLCIWGIYAWTKDDQKQKQE